jgi:hypothetical protein
LCVNERGGRGDVVGCFEGVCGCFRRTGVPVYAGFDERGGETRIPRVDCHVVVDWGSGRCGCGAHSG